MLLFVGIAITDNIKNVIAKEVVFVLFRSLLAEGTLSTLLDLMTLVVF